MSRRRRRTFGAGPGPRPAGQHTAWRLVHIGQSMVEYAIIAAIVAVVALAAVRGLGGSITALFGQVQSCVNQAAGDGASC
jgi:Flp pilus assembly pilin Flp